MKDAIVSTARLLPAILTGTFAGAGLRSVLHLNDMHWQFATLICVVLTLALHRYVRVARWLMTAGTVVALLFLVGHSSMRMAALFGVGVVFWLVLRAVHRHLLARRSLPRPVQHPTLNTPTQVFPGHATPQQANLLDDRVHCARFSFDSIVGMAQTKNRLLNAARDVLTHPEQARNGILLSGEPGNGKTMFAEALAGELGIPFFSISYQDIASKWINETPERVKAAFAQATRLGHLVFFIDEIDGFIKSRNDQPHSMDRDLCNTMLTEIARLRHGATGTILIAATNDLGWLDGAAVREGRFDFKVEVPPPIRRPVRQSFGVRSARRSGRMRSAYRCSRVSQRAGPASALPAWQLSGRNSQTCGGKVSLETARCHLKLPCRPCAVSRDRRGNCRRMSRQLKRSSCPTGHETS